MVAYYDGYGLVPANLQRSGPIRQYGLVRTGPDFDCYTPSGKSAILNRMTLTKSHRFLFLGANTKFEVNISILYRIMAQTMFRPYMAVSRPS